jgi:nicotinate-nucleotide adenylyltransferase
MRIGVQGGSFDPPHVGHAMVAAWLRWTDRVDEVWLVPAFDHPFGKAMSPFHDRVRWCEALASVLGPWARVDPIERDLGGTSYTVRTLDALAALHPEHRFHLVIGADVLGDTPRWKDWARIASVYAPIVVGRAGHGDVATAPTFPEVSSTAIRRALASGDDV